MRWIFRLIGLVVVLVVVAVAALFLVPAERIANLATQQFESATGRALTITGSVRPTLWPTIGARIEGVTLANVAGSSAGPMFTAQTVELGVDLSALIGGAVAVKTFEVSQPVIILERDANGRGNWVFEGLGSAEAAPAGSATESAGGLPAITLDQALISGARLRFIDHAAGTDITLEGVDVDLRMPSISGPADVTLSVRRGGQTGRVQARIGSVSGLLAGEVVAITAALSADGAEASFEGRAGLEPLAAEGRISFDASRLAPALAIAGVAGAEPLPEGARPLTLGGQFTLAPAGSVHLRDGMIGVGTNRIRAALDLVTAGERPNLTGEIGADSLDLRPFLAGGEAAPSSGPGWPTARIDASALGLMDARIGLTLGPVQTGFGDLTSVRGALVIDRARGVLELAEVRAFDGTIAGQVVANNRSGLSVGGTMQLRGVQLLPLLRQAAEFERLAGTAAIDLRFLGSGASVDAIMRSLEGEGRLDFSRGEIIGFDLAGMLRNLDASYVGEGNSTIFESLTGSYTMQNGVLRNEDLALVASLVTVAGTGTVNLGEQVLEYRVTPEAMRNAETGSSLRVPLLITGPWSAPRFRLDLEGMAEARLAEERERLEAAAREELQRLEDEARARVQQEIRDRIGVTVGDGQSAQDAVQQGVEDRARNQLQQLLTGGSGGGTAPAPDAAPAAAAEPDGDAGSEADDATLTPEERAERRARRQARRAAREAAGN